MPKMYLLIVLIWTNLVTNQRNTFFEQIKCSFDLIHILINNDETFEYSKR